MFENFKKAVAHPTYTNNQVETFFYQLDSEHYVDALSLFEQYRPKLGRKIASEILKAATTTA